MRTVGVEEELLLVEPETGIPIAVVGSLLSVARAPQFQGADPGEAERRSMLEAEVKQEQVEVVSPPHASLDSLATSVMAGRRAADESARQVGARAVALGTSVLPVVSHASPGRRFEEMRERFGQTFDEQLTCGFHVHVAISSPDEGVAVLDRIRPWLPVLLALSTNSPFWMGKDTSFSSYRYQAWGRWPTAGMYDVFGSAQAYRQTVESMVDTGVLLDRGMIYFDARLCERYPTVEVRLADVCMDPEHAVILAALVRALVDTVASEWRAGIAHDPVPTSRLRLAMWAASRFGIDGNFYNPLRNSESDAHSVVRALLEYVDLSLMLHGDDKRVHGSIARLLAEGTGATFQRQQFELTGSLTSVVSSAITRTNASITPNHSAITQ